MTSAPTAYQPATIAAHGALAEHPASPSGLRVLLVEDDPLVSELVEMILLGRGHEVVACSDTRAAIAAFGPATFQIVLLDRALPDGDGLDICRRIREAGGNQTAILVMTGQGGPGDLAAVFEAGANDYLRKPFDLEELTVRLAVAEQHTRLAEKVAVAGALQHLSQLKSQFISTAAHELRTPLSLVYGYAELMALRAERLDPPAIAEMAGQVQAGAQTMIRLVDDMLAFARSETAGPGPGVDRIDLAALLRDTIWRFHSQPGGERLRCDLPSELAARADPDRTRQVLENLLSNALLFAPEGPITVSAQAVEGAVKVSVNDHGPGIPADEQPRVWELLYRGQETVNSPRRGSGLGLTVVKRLVELQGGAVGVQSQPGQGSTFWFTLPAPAQ